MRGSSSHVPLPVQLRPSGSFSGSQPANNEWSKQYLSVCDACSYATGNHTSVANRTLAAASATSDTTHIGH